MQSRFGLFQWLKGFFHKQPPYSTDPLDYKGFILISLTFPDIELLRDDIIFLRIESNRSE